MPNFVTMLIAGITGGILGLATLGFFEAYQRMQKQFPDQQLAEQDKEENYLYLWTVDEMMLYNDFLNLAEKLAGELLESENRDAE